MAHNLIFIDEITPEFLTEAKAKFKRWIRTHQGHRDVLELDTWNTIELENGGFIDFHLDLYDGDLTLELFPCNTPRYEKEGATTEVWIGFDRTNSVVIRDNELTELLPQSIIEYVKEQRSYADES